MKGNIIDNVIPVDFGRGSRVEPISQPLPSVSQSTGTQQIRPQDPEIRESDQRISFLEQRRVEIRNVFSVKLHLLPNKRLNLPLDVIVEQDDGGFIARPVGLPLYGYGEGPNEAIEMLSREIESLYEDLLEDDDFSDKWLRIKRFLCEVISD